MNTFLPYPSYLASAESLDYKRLGKQRVETKQILNALGGLSKGWVNHPATKMWSGYEYSLAKYGLIVCKVWVERGYKDTLTNFFTDYISNYEGNRSYPHWLGDTKLHISHQSNLVRKDPAFYIPIFGNVPDDIPYVWREGKVV
jgi:hypothetical protein